MTINTHLSVGHIDVRNPLMRTPITHPLNVSYLVVGLVFLGIAGSWALRTAGIVDNRDVGWLLPAVLVAAGVVGLVAFAAKGLSRAARTRRRRRPTTTTDPTRRPTTTDI